MKLLLAGADGPDKVEVIYGTKHKSILTSFHAHRNKFNEKWLRWYEKTRDCTWVMDSGLFTMMFGAGSNKTYTEKDLLEYTNNYINRMTEIDFEGYIVEMDVHKVLGLESLKTFRDIFEDRWPLEKTIYVWHVEEKEDGFRKLCKKYPYIAISIPELRKVLNGRKTLKNAVKHLISLANSINPNIKIHLLGCTQQDLMLQKGYYSCDSTSWLAGSKYGSGVIFKKDRIIQANVRSALWGSMREKYRESFEELNFENIKNTDYYLDLYICGKEYSKMNEYINNKYYNYEKV
tara:strand:+ start:439 stop:1308 length:870 start_codon:yes stop_codon:yes gene_type:complete